MSNQIAVVDERIRTLLPVHLLTVGAEHLQAPIDRPKFSFYQFLYIEKGEGIFEGADGVHRLLEGMTLYTAKGSSAAYRGTTEDFQTGWVTFDGPQAKSILEYFRAEESAILRSDAVRVIMHDIRKSALRNAPPEVLSHRVYELITAFFGALNEGRKTPKLLQAKKYIIEHCMNDLSVADVARAVGISEALLFRIFHTEEKSTPALFLRDARIKRAKEFLLDRPGMRVSEIAEASGFSNAAYFCKVFRSVTGMTPKAYRALYLL